MKWITDESMVKVFKTVYSELEDRNCKLRLLVLDNQCSKVIKTFVKKKNVDIFLVKPYNHRVKAEEPAVKTSKYHTISVLCTIDKRCPIQVWDKFIPQIQDTLNMLQTSRRDPTISAYEELNSEFDYNKTPTTILGTRVSVFDNDHPTWAPHSEIVYIMLAHRTTIID